MPAKRCVETKNMCLLFVDYCKEAICTQKKKGNWVRRGKKAIYTQKEKRNWVQRGEKVICTQKEKGNGAGRKETEYGSL